jgi:hypothetical protein
MHGSIENLVESTKGKKIDCCTADVQEKMDQNC